MVDGREGMGVGDVGGDGVFDELEELVKGGAVTEGDIEGAIKGL